MSQAAGAADLADAPFPGHDALASSYQSGEDFDRSGIGLLSLKARGAQKRKPDDL